MFLNITDKTSPETMEKLLDKLIIYGVELGKDIIAAVLIYIIGRFIIRQLKNVIDKILLRRKIDPSVHSFIQSLTSLLLNLVLVFAVVAQLGIDTASFTALFVSAGAAIGMALSGNLSNFAGGLILLIFKPFKVGDFIETSTVSGTVKEIQIFHTILITPDNKIIYTPNGVMSSNYITNYSVQDKRRAEWILRLDADKDFNAEKEKVQTILQNDKRILATPEPLIVINALHERRMEIMIRAWALSTDFWDVYYDVYEKLQQQGFPEEGHKHK